jgi:hypothetical protein
MAAPARGEEVSMSREFTAKNMGGLDRIIRLVLGLFLIAAAFTQIPVAGAIVLGIVGGILVLTGLVARCPLYSICGVNTGKPVQPKHA